MFTIKLWKLGSESSYQISTYLYISIIWITYT